MTTLTATLTPIAPYSFELALDYVRAWSAATLETVDQQAGVWRRALRLAGRDALLTLRSVGTPVAPRLELTVAGDDIDATTLAAAVARVRAVFGLDRDPAPFLELAAGDPPLAEFVARFGAIRPVLVADPFETLIWAVLGQQINIGFARKLKLALVEVGGARLRVEDVDYPLMPPPERVAALDPAALLARQYSRQKVSYTLGLARAVVDGDLDFEALRALPAEGAIAELTRFRGVGRWTAEYVLMRGFGHPATLPAGDVSLQLLLGNAWLGRRASEAELRELATRWPGWAGWVAFYVWMARTMSERPAP